MRRFLVVGALAATVAAAVAAPGVGAATRFSTKYSVRGIETSIPTNNTSTFGGAATGSSGDLALWKASVVHQGLSNCPFGSGTGCAITGGTFSLRSPGGTVAGTFVGGKVTPVSQGTPCGNQVFGVTGTLATNHGSGTFAATLTHYRTALFGSCITYFATIKGSVALSTA
jgi:hypothetical protein